MREYLSSQEFKELSKFIPTCQTNKTVCCDNELSCFYCCYFNPHYFHRGVNAASESSFLIIFFALLTVSTCRTKIEDKTKGAEAKMNRAECAEHTRIHQQYYCSPGFISILAP